MLLCVLSWFLITHKHSSSSHVHIVSGAAFYSTTKAAQSAFSSDIGLWEYHFLLPPVFGTLSPQDLHFESEIVKWITLTQWATWWEHDRDDSCWSSYCPGNVQFLLCKNTFSWKISGGDPKLYLIFFASPCTWYAIFFYVSVVFLYIFIILPVIFFLTEWKSSNAFSSSDLIACPTSFPVHVGTHKGWSTREI